MTQYSKKLSKPQKYANGGSIQTDGVREYNRGRDEIDAIVDRGRNPAPAPASTPASEPTAAPASASRTGPDFGSIRYTPSTSQGNDDSQLDTDTSAGNESLPSSSDDLPSGGPGTSSDSASPKSSGRKGSSGSSKTAPVKRKAATNTKSSSPTVSSGATSTFAPPPDPSPTSKASEKPKGFYANASANAPDTGLGKMFSKFFQGSSRSSGSGRGQALANGGSVGSGAVNAGKVSPLSNPMENVNGGGGRSYSKK